VKLIENYNARYMEKSDLPFVPTLCVMDVSFISSTHIIPAVHGVLCEGGDFILLVKPQFEVGRQNLGKGGIVKDEKNRISALKKVVDFATSIGFIFVNSITSPITGGDGNKEYLVHFKVR